MAASSRLFFRLPYLMLGLVVLVAVLPFFLLSYYNHPFMDDYFNAANVRTTGLWGQQVGLYMKWTGRFLGNDYRHLSLRQLRNGSVLRRQNYCRG